MMEMKERLSWALHGVISGISIKSRLNYVNVIEKDWGNRMINQVNNNQWTTLLGESLVRDTLKEKGVNVWSPNKINGYHPDLETERYIYEVKTRNWTTTGTAGEKVLGVPYKYSDIPRLYNKPLRIVCVAYQEYELSNGNSNIFGQVSNEKSIMLNMWKQMNIEFVQFSKLIESNDV